MVTLARETGWAETEILKMPLARALKYLHAALWANGAWTVKPQPRAVREAGLQSLFAQLPAFADEEGDE